ncbi:MAG: peptide ABC transporter substrate-binding protein, partial [Dehalococcoidia bacterium]
DGRPITAEDVRYSIERAADPELMSDTAETYLGDIVGVTSKLAGEANEVSGVEVLDSRTIRITIDAPKAYFLAKMTYPTAAVVDRETIEAAGVEWWRVNVNGSGPFKLREWTDGEVLVLERFDDYPTPSKLEYAIFPIQAGIPVQMYEADLADVVFIGGPDVDRAQDPATSFFGQLQVFPQFSTFYVGFNAKEPPFDDPKVRLAFAMAVDRDRFVEVVFEDDVTVATGLLPPGLPGFSTDLRGIRFDPEAAKALLAQSTYADGLPTITYTASGVGSAPASVQFMIDEWRQNLDVEVGVHLLEQDAYFYQLAEQVDNIFSYGWQADYPDPQNFLDILLHSKSLDNNIGGYANAEFDDLLERARVERDFDARMALYGQAEQVLLDDAGIIPLYHSPDYVLTKPFVEGFKIGPLGIPLLQNVEIGPR